MAPSTLRRCARAERRTRWVQVQGPHGSTSVSLPPAWQARAERDGQAALGASGPRYLTNAVRSAAENLCVDFDAAAGSFSQQVRVLAHRTLVKLAKGQGVEV